MANLFLAYIDKRLAEVKKSTNIQSLAFFHTDLKKKTGELRSFVGERPAYTSFPLGAGQIGKAALMGKAFTFKEAHPPLPQMTEQSFQRVVPVEFNSENVGILSALSNSKEHLEKPDLVAELNSLAAQIGTLWVQPAREHAIVVDERMGKLKALHKNYDWVGVYKLVKETLYLVSFRGTPSPHEIIPKANGICGAAVAENRTLNIEDVSADARYLSCDSRTRSEIVVPIRNDAGQPIGEIDIDSHTLSAFNQDDTKELEELASELAPLVVNLI